MGQRGLGVGDWGHAHGPENDWHAQEGEEGGHREKAQREDSEQHETRVAKATVGVITRSTLGGRISA